MMNHTSTKLIIIVSVSIILILSALNLFAQGGQPLKKQYEVKRGDRPTINLQALPDDAWHKGVLIIKIREEFTDLLENNPASLSKEGNPRFNITSLDLLNQTAQARNFNQYFKHPALGNTFTERHKAWGFHLWYKLEFDESSDIISLVSAFQALDEVEIAEPKFRVKSVWENTNGSVSEPQVPKQNLPMNITNNWVPNDPSFNNQWHYHNTGQHGGTPGADIDLLQAWEIEKGNPHVIVAIVDDGIPYTHPDLIGNMWQGIGYNFVAGSSAVTPGNHGAHVAGTVAAVSNNGLGVSGVAGGSGSGDGVRLMSCEVFSGNDQDGFHIAPIWAADHGAAISQNSWGYIEPNTYDQNVLDAIDYFNLNGGGDALNGGITIFAAGNDNSSGAWYPGFYSGAFTVAATNHNDAKAWYSNYDTWIDISAPGGEMHPIGARGVLSNLINNGYGYFQGTSMACPHVSGVAALIISHAYGELTANDVRDILLNTTDDHYAVNPDYIGQLGTGRLNAYQALIETQTYISGITLNPIAFKSQTDSPYDIALTWFQNSDNDEVLIALAADNTFGAPDSGMVYQLGDYLPGGGQVLYKGSETYFLHSGLEQSTKYVYKAWSYNTGLNYSSGRESAVFTACGFKQLPFSEGFEEGSDIPLCWNQDFDAGNTSWTTGAGNGENSPPAAYEGSQNIFFREQDPAKTGATTRLIAPALDLASFESVTLSFNYTNALRYDIASTHQDTLRIKYKPDYFSEWETLAVFDTDVSSWTQANLNLPALSGTYFLAFEARSAIGYGVCIDNIIITGFGTVNHHNIYSTSGRNGSITPKGNISAIEGSQASFQAQASPHHIIDSLRVDGILVEGASGSADHTYTFNNIVQNHNIHVTYRPVAHNITAIIIPANSGVLEGTGTYPHNHQVTIQAIPSPGYQFNMLLEGATVISYAPTTPLIPLKSNRHFIARFTLIPYTISAGVYPEGSGSVSGTGIFYYGGQVTLSANAAIGFMFTHWEENGEVVSTDNPYVFQVAEGRSLTAHFATAVYSIDVIAEPENAGIISGYGSFVHGEPVELLATANPDFVFIDWKEGDEIVSSENPYVFMASKNRSLEARFELLTGLSDKMNDAFRIYPNPTQGYFYITLAQQVDLRIIDITGREIIQMQALPGTSAIDTNEMQRGLYLVILRSGESIKAQRLVIY